MCPDLPRSRRDGNSPCFSLPAMADFDPERFTLAEADLRQALDGFLQAGSEVLDLRAHAQALRQSPDELMEQFADACRRAGRRVRALRLSAPWEQSPSWLGAFPGVACWAEGQAPLARAA